MRTALVAAAAGLAAVLVALPGPVAAAGQTALRGEAVEGGMMRGTVDPGARLWLDGTPVPVGPDGRFAFGFHRDSPEEMTLRIVYPDGDEETWPLRVRQRDYDIQRIDGLPPSKVTPSETELERIRAEQELIDAARAKVLDHDFFDQSFIWPATGRISGVYGSQRVLNGEPRSPHFGLDIAAPEGTPVKAPADAVVTLTHEGMFFSGKTVILDHGMGITSIMIHLSAIAVEEGQTVRQGEVVGRIGQTGRATGPHLHWGMNWGNDIRLDPQLLLGEMPE